MKILYITHETELNGASKSLLELIDYIKGKGIYPIVVLPDKGKMKRELAGRKIDARVITYRRCVYRGKFSLRDYMNYYVYDLKAVWELVKIIREESIDIVHSNSLAVDAGAAAAYLAGIPHVWHCREYMEEDFNFKYINPLINRWLIRKSNCRISISAGIMEKIERTYGVRSVRMYNGIDARQYFSPIRSFPETAPKNRLLIAGAVSEGKGQWDAIRAVEILNKRGIHVDLSIVGDGDPHYLKELRKYISHHHFEDCITFTPYTKELQKLRLESEIVLVCSRMEAFGRVTAEAMMAGKVVIGASTGGTAELIGSYEERGYLYTWNHPEELADKIEHALKNPDEVCEKEKLAQEFIVRATNLETYTDKLIRIYQKILMRQKG